MKNKKTLLIVLSILTVVVIAFSFFVNRYPSSINLLTAPNLPSNNKPADFTQLKSTDYQKAAEDQYRPNRLNPKSIKYSVPADPSVLEISKISSDLPIYISNFQTSSGISTSINVFILPDDPTSVLHIEIYGPDYLTFGTKANDKNIVAFIESFNHIKKILSEKNVDLSKIQIVYNTIEYIHYTAEGWVNSFKLLP